jgi:dihydroorotate dehydrogenase electron transfer subunit
MTDKPHRGTIFVEEAEVLAHDVFPGEQYVLRLAAPECALAARPGSFVHLRCDPMLPMRRPLSLLRTDARAGWIECLYKAVGDGTRLLTQRKTGERISVMGPIGQPFAPDPDRSRPLLIGGGVGMPPMIFLASDMRASSTAHPFVILGSEVPFPFDPRPSQVMVPGLPAGVIAAMPLLDDWGVPSRLASLQGFPGCHDGYVTDLARHWLDRMDDDTRALVEVFACGPHAMLAAVAALARDYDLPCQVSLEEYMACGVGGCAGCVVEVQTSDGPGMKRVCVDGPVFHARQIFR